LTAHRPARRIFQEYTRNSWSAFSAIGCALAIPDIARAQNLPAAGSGAVAQPNATHRNIARSSQSAVVNSQCFSAGSMAAAAGQEKFS
jgi:hypothetical protein